MNRRSLFHGLLGFMAALIGYKIAPAKAALSIDQVANGARQYLVSSVTRSIARTACGVHHYTTMTGLSPIDGPQPPRQFIAGEPTQEGQLVFFGPDGQMYSSVYTYDVTGVTPEGTVLKRVYRRTSNLLLRTQLR